MKNIFLSLISFLLFSAAMQSFAQAKPADRLQLWFDLGNVLIETRDGFQQLRWMPGAREMLERLRAQGFSIGLISNVPENWGERGNPESKIIVLQELLNKGWTDRHPIQLSQFDKIFVPDTRDQAKPAEFLFKKAKLWALHRGRKSFFQGESPREVQTARKIGMRSFLVEFEANGRRPKYFPTDQLKNIKFGVQK